MVVTRAAHQAGPTLEAFRRAGARVEALPLLEVIPPEDPAPFEAALARLETYGWIAFTSKNTVAAVFDRLASSGAGSGARPLPPTLAVAAVGPATARALEARGVTADLVAEDPRAEGLAEALQDVSRGRSILLPQAADARPLLEERLRATGLAVERVDAYAKGTPPDAPERARRIFGDDPAEPLGWVVFTSPSTARAFAALWPPETWAARRPTLRPVAIGPVTGAALEDLGTPPAAVAREPSDEGLVAAVVAACREGPRGAERRADPRP